MTHTDDALVEAMAKAIAEWYPPRKNKTDGYIKPVWDMLDIEDLAEHTLEAVHAHLAERVLSPEVVEAVAKAGISEWDAYVPDGPVHQGARIMAKEQMEAALTAIGIRKETENVDAG